jgi:hypothetical protein
MSSARWAGGDDGLAGGGLDLAFAWKTAAIANTKMIAGGNDLDITTPS